MMANVSSKTRFRVDFFCCGTPATNTFQVSKLHVCLHFFFNLSRYSMGLQGVTLMRTLVRKCEQHKTSKSCLLQSDRGIQIKKRGCILQ